MFMSVEPRVIFISQLESPIGMLWLASGVHGLIKIAFDKEKDHKLEWLLRKFPNAKRVSGERENLGFHKELNEYFQGRRKNFTVKVDLIVSDFSKTVLNQVARIPFGATASYKYVAEAINKPNAARAVGRALATNPVPIIIPCHRVVGSDGKLVGFGGGLDIKKWLISYEKGLTQ